MRLASMDPQIQGTLSSGVLTFRCPCGGDRFVRKGEITNLDGSPASIPEASAPETTADYIADQQMRDY